MVLFDVSGQKHLVKHADAIVELLQSRFATVQLLHYGSVRFFRQKHLVKHADAIVELLQNMFAIVQLLHHGSV